MKLLFLPVIENVKGEVSKATENSVNENVVARKTGWGRIQCVREWENDSLCYRNPLTNLFS